jgi:diguanylate cyclase (GGDEF)-like protein
VTGRSVRLSGRTAAAVRRWPLWSLRRVSRAYVIAVPLLAAVALCVAAAYTSWQPFQASRFVLLLACAAVMLEATRDVNFPQGTLTRDLQEVWYLAIALFLPPVYALAAPIPLVAIKQWRVQRGVVHRRVFSMGALGLGYAAASWEVHLLAPVLTGHHAGDIQGVGWLVVTVAAALTGWLANSVLIVGAVKLADPSARVRMMFNREAFATDAVAMCLACLIAIALRFSFVILVLALPVVLMQKRFLMHNQLVAEARLDSKTGLLNAATWQREAQAELSRARRLQPPASAAIVDIDHFKVVNDSHGHLVGDRVLRAIAERFLAQLRDADLIGRFGGEEFAILLPRTAAAEAGRVAERLRTYIAGEPIAVDDGRGERILVGVTVSVGVAELGDSAKDLDELLAAADVALYEAKNAGRNRTRVMGPALAGQVPAPRGPEQAADAHQ